MCDLKNINQHLLSYETSCYQWRSDAFSHMESCCDETRLWPPAFSSSWASGQCLNADAEDASLASIPWNRGTSTSQIANRETQITRRREVISVLTAVMVDSMLLLDRSSHCFCCVALCCVCWNQQWPNLNSPENLAQKKFTAAKLTSMLPPFPQLQWPRFICCRQAAFLKLIAF